MVLFPKSNIGRICIKLFDNYYHKKVTREYFWSQLKQIQDLLNLGQGSFEFKEVEGNDRNRKN
ncbi:MAG: hypothetical protein AB1567_06905 [bacterium]